MTTPAPTNGTQNGTKDRPQAWYDAVDAVTVRARKYLGKSLDNRITKARHLILNQQIENHGRYGLIRSESDPETLYKVDNEGCDCQDAQYTAPQGLCAHRLAWAWLAKRTTSRWRTGTGYPPLSPPSRSPTRTTRRRPPPKRSAKRRSPGRRCRRRRSPSA